MCLLLFKNITIIVLNATLCEIWLKRAYINLYSLTKNYIMILRHYFFEI